MKRRRMIQNALIIVLGISIIIMSIGYAAYGTNINIIGSATIENDFWDVHFENTTSTSNTTVSDYERITPPFSNSNTTSLNFAVSLRAGEVYELTTTIRNGGKYDAKLAEVLLNATTDEEGTTRDLTYENEYIKYVVTYDDGTTINVGDTIDAGFSRKILVRVESLNPSDEESTPTVDQVYNFNLKMNYAQA